MILTIDVGNSNIESGIFSEEPNDQKLIASFRIGTNRSITTDELGIMFKEMLIHNNVAPTSITGGIYSSVVPPINHSINKMIFKYFNCNPVLVTHEDFSDVMAVRYDEPNKLGTDRLVNAYAVIKLYSTPAIIIDFGTATTFCAVSGRNEYLGGLIIPGISISLEALVNRTSKLPKVELGTPKRVIETDTVRGMQAGIYYETVESVNGIVRRMKQEMSEEKPISVIATGGLSNFIAHGSEEIDIVDDFLSLKGLKILYNKEKRG
ncbi:MAG: type III pantothenate kinase [Spirochaetes bacterium]|nr:type III pantothenate kinase [Spirochaetota bacterium]